MKVNNRDLFPTDAVMQHYASVEPLLRVSELEDQFLLHDKASNSAKSKFHKLGQLAIVLVAFSAIYTIAEALILPELLNNVILKLIAVISAGLGICFQLFLILTKQKSKWLLHRFATERLRSLKFQSFYLAHQAETTQELETLVDAFEHEHLARLDNELNAGISVLKNFSPVKALAIPSVSAKPKNPEMARQAFDAYKELRIKYQRNFAQSEVTKFSGRRRLFNSTQDMIYLGAAFFAFFSLGLKMFGSAEMPTAWIDFAAVTLFILGATEAIMDNALLEEQSQTRYEQYVREIDEVSSDGYIKGKNMPRIIKDMERICLFELDVFARAADRISYRY